MTAGVELFSVEHGGAVQRLFLSDKTLTMMRYLCLLLILFCALNSAHAYSAEPGWSNAVIATGSQREKISSTPIVKRPYRPLHFYGNTVRRMHYRGTPIPAPRDLASVGNLLGGLVRPFR